MTADVPLPFDDHGDVAQPAPPAEAPCVYVATKITGVAPASPERQIIDLAVTAIRDAISECTTQAADQWILRIHAPVEWTSPELTPDMKPSEVFGTNAQKVIGDTDALIVYGYGPSAGVGQEVAWAAQLGIPVLYIEPPGHLASRQIAGTSGDIEVRSYTVPDQLKETVRCWIRSRRHQIEASPGRRRTRLALTSVIRTQLCIAWESRPLHLQQRTAAHVGVTPSLIEWWLSDDAIFAAAPFQPLTALCVSLLGSADAITSRRSLTTVQFEALLIARDEHGWDDHAVDDLRHRAERELARPAIRRFRLESSDDWVRFHDATRR